MAERRITISEASALTGLESHVLRYWEEELELDIPRNEMGHRYYTDKHIKLFKQIKMLKDTGYQLKAIRNTLDEKNKSGQDNVIILPNLRNSDDAASGAITQEITGKIQDAVLDKKIIQFQAVIGNMLNEALSENNNKITDKIIKEMNYIARMREEAEEERFKKFDEIIRNVQKGRQEAAYTGETAKKKRWPFHNKG